MKILDYWFQNKGKISVVIVLLSVAFILINTYVFGAAYDGRANWLVAWCGFWVMLMAMCGVKEVKEKDCMKEEDKEEIKVMMSTIQVILAHSFPHGQDENYNPQYLMSNPKKVYTLNCALTKILKVEKYKEKS